MSFPFNAQRGLVLVDARVFGPRGGTPALLALDTGATETFVSQAILVAVGYDPALAARRIQVTTGSGVVFVPRLTIDKLVALGQTRSNFTVLAHTLPPSATIDGVLGLDFFRGQTLTIDFRTGQITLA